MSALEERPSWVVYDGECPICRDLAHRWLKRGGAGMHLLPYQEVGNQFPGIDTRDFATAVHLVESDGEVYKGAAAIFRILARRPHWRWLLWLYRRVPGFGGASEWVYRWVARQRRKLRHSGPCGTICGEHIE